MSLHKASAPGSLMLLGEYAVLHGHSALVCAIDKRITVQLEPRDDREVTIRSGLGNYATTIDELEVIPPFTFVLATLKFFQSYLTRGCNITITADFSDQIGFASSAAVTVATFTVLAGWLELTYSEKDSIRHCRALVQSVQGSGSGADVAACVTGGVIAYHMKPFRVEKFAVNPPLTVIYSGHKTPTPVAIAKVADAFSSYPSLFNELMKTIGHCAALGIQAVKQERWDELGKFMVIQQGLMESLGVSTPLLHLIIEQLTADPKIYGAKISGAGLGDCIVGLGEAREISIDDSRVKHIAVAVDQQGVIYEEI